MQLKRGLDFAKVVVLRSVGQILLDKVEMLSCLEWLKLCEIVPRLGCWVQLIGVSILKRW